MLPSLVSLCSGEGVRGEVRADHLNLLAVSLPHGPACALPASCRTAPIYTQLSSGSLQYPAMVSPSLQTFQLDPS